MAKRKKMPSRRIDPRKAEMMLEDDEARGHPLTDKQRRMMHAAANRGKKGKKGR